MSKSVSYRGIEGVTGREPVGAVLTIGVKGERGNPTDTDRFFLVVPTMGADGRRAKHPDFARFNDAPVEHRQTIHANLVHAAEPDAWSYRLRAQVLPGDQWPAHPDKRPACEGDGERATRYFGETGTDDFREIPCPNEACEFRIGTGAKPCKPSGTLYFRVRWPDRVDLPTPLTKWATGSWHSVSAVVGFFDYVREQASGLGLDTFSLYGLPFALTLSRKTKPSARAAFPVVSISPECDLVDFFLRQREQLRELGGDGPKLLPVGAQDPREQSSEEQFADFATITPGHVRKPAETAVPLQEEETKEVIDVSPATDLDERWKSILAEARKVGQTEAAVVDVLAAMGVDGFPDLEPAQDQEVIRRLHLLAKRAKRA